MRKTINNLPLMQLSDEYNASKIVVDKWLQRGLVWNIEQKRLWIDSLLKDWAIPPVHLWNNDGVLHIQDGQQRISTVASFFGDGFHLGEDFVLTLNDQEYDLSEKYYSGLPENIRMILNSRIVIAFEYTGATKHEMDNIFMRLNNGTSVKKSVAMLSVAGDTVNRFCSAILEHPFFAKIPFITPSNYNTGEVKLIPVQILAMINYDSGLTNDNCKELAKPALFGSQFCGEEDMNAVVEVLDYLNDIHFDLSKKNSKITAKNKGKYWFYKKQHFFTIVYFARRAIDLKMDGKTFYDMIEDFFNQKDTSPNYIKYMENVGKACLSYHKVEQRKNMIDAYMENGSMTKVENFNKKSEVKRKK